MPTPKSLIGAKEMKAGFGELTSAGHPYERIPDCLTLFSFVPAPSLRFRYSTGVKFMMAGFHAVHGIGWVKLREVPGKVIEISRNHFQGCGIPGS